MLLSLLTGSTPPLPHIPLPPKDPPAIVKELTVEEKIQTNFYKCNTDLQWIRADNAQCLNKTQVAAEKPSEPIENKPQQASTGLNGYAYPSCTGHVALKRYVPPGLGNAYSWLANAQARGMATGSVPRVGAIGWRGNHVVYVESVHGDTITISENNYDYAGSTRTIDRPSNYYTYIY